MSTSRIRGRAPRAARLLLRILDEDLRPAIVRVPIPALVRGDELITKTGCYGDVVREAQRVEREGRALAAAVMIGNPFTDVPELCSQTVVVTEDAAPAGSAEAARLAAEFWANRQRMQAKLIAVDRAIAQARHLTGPVIFTDAADATSSGATGDSNAILAALLAAGYDRSALIPIVDPPAAAEAHRAGVGRHPREARRRVGPALRAGRDLGRRRHAVIGTCRARNERERTARRADGGSAGEPFHHSRHDALGQPV
jgi:microcystin degradation protein MlrC